MHGRGSLELVTKSSNGVVERWIDSDQALQIIAVGAAKHS